MPTNPPPPLFWVENHEYFGFFILSRKVFRDPDSMGFVWGGVGQELSEKCSLCIFHPRLLCWRFGDLGDPVVPTLRLI